MANNLSSDFDKLTVSDNFVTLIGTQSSYIRVQKRGGNTYSGKRNTYSTVPKYVSRLRMRRQILKPARLKLPVYKKRIVLKPAVLHLAKTNESENLSKPNIIDRKLMPKITEGKVFNRRESLLNFKTVASTTNVGQDVLQAFNTMSFKNIRSKTSNISQAPVDNNKDNSSNSTSCSLQARLELTLQSNNNCCDDTTIDELASYFDLLVHIPKKMSSMAEMMYI